MAALLLGLALTLGLAVPLYAQTAVEPGITNSVLLTWPETTNDCIVVAADEPTNSSSVWTPWPEPIFKRGHELCMAVPATAPRQFFQLMTGSQFMDDFSPAPQWPFATRGDWVTMFVNPADSTRFVVTNVNESLRIYSVTPAIDGRVGVLPPETKSLSATLAHQSTS